MEKTNVNAQEDGLEIDYFSGSWEMQISGTRKEKYQRNIKGLLARGCFIGICCNGTSRKK